MTTYTDLKRLLHETKGRVKKPEEEGAISTVGAMPQEEKLLFLKRGMSQSPIPPKRMNPLNFRIKDAFERRANNLVLLGRWVYGMAFGKKQETDLIIEFSQIGLLDSFIKGDAIPCKVVTDLFKTINPKFDSGIAKLVKV
jgi:hypothetical protein